MTSINLRGLASGLVLAAAVLPATAQSTNPDTLISLQFRGGTATEYLAAVRRVAGDQFNVIIAPEAGEVSVPVLELTRVSPSSAVRLLDGLAEERPGHAVRLTINEVPRETPAEQPTYLVRAQVRSAARSHEVHVWTVQSLLDHGYTSEAVISAIELGLAVVGSPEPPDVRFHEDTGLIIATGEKRQLDTIEQVVSSLRVAIDEREHAEQQARDDEARAAQMRMRHELEELEMANQNLTRVLMQREQELAQARSDFERLKAATRTIKPDVDLRSDR